MSTVLNDRDAILQAATVRIVNPKNAWINLTASAPGFHLNAAGQVDLAKVTVTADLVGLDDTVSFTAVGGTLSNAVGRSVDVTYDGQTAIVTAKVVSNGDEFQRALIIPVLRDGASGTGTPGARGAGHYYGSGTAWTDALANITVPTTKVVGDVVTISSGTFVMEKRWTGSAWVENGVPVDGNLIVTGSILGSAIKAGTLDIRAPDGSIIIAANLPLAQQVASNPNLLPSVRFWNTFYGGASAGMNAADTTSGEYIWLPANTGAGYIGLEQGITLPQNGDWVTLSCKAIAVDAGASFRLDFYNGGNVQLGLEGTPALGAGYVPYSATFQLPVGATGVRVRAYSLNKSKNIAVAEVKLELGRKVTPWNDSVITPNNVAQKVAPNSINNTQFGGDLFSTNYVNGVSGWYLERNGDIWVNNIRSRGYISGGAIYGWGWPAAGNGTGFYVGPQGALFGNKNDNLWLALLASGAIESKNFNVDANGNVIINGALIINPDIQQAQLGMSGVPSSINGGSSLPNDTAWRVYGSFTVTPTNVQGTATVTAFINVTEGEMRISQSGNTITVSGRGTGGAGGTSGRSNSGTVFIFVTDSNNRNATARVSAFANHGIIQ